MGLFLRTSLAVAALTAALATIAPLHAFAQAWSDQALQDRVTFALNTTKVPRIYDLTVSVVEGITTLGGLVATPEQRAEVERLARQAGAKSLVNSVVVNRDVEQMLADRRAPGYSKGNDPITDTWITNRVQNFFMRDEQIRGGDLTIETLNGVVSLRGRVRSEPGRHRAMELASTVPGVRRVLDFMVIGR
jgi:osmotically-inducible protein OsmY